MYENKLKFIKLDISHSELPFEKGSPEKRHIFVNADHIVSFEQAAGTTDRTKIRSTGGYDVIVDHSENEIVDLLDINNRRGF